MNACVHHLRVKPGLPSWLFLLVILAALPGCRTYYQRQQEFQSHFQSGNIEQAAQVLESDSRAENRRTRLLHLMNQGVVQHMLGNYTASNDFFERAYILGEDFRRNYGDEALALLINPNVTEYRGEPFELLMIHYYKAMNFIQLGDLDAAMVECRRLNIALNALSDRYNNENRYRRDAFIHTLMGILYDATGDYNNAFIAYRNAVGIYQDDYSRLFNVGVPEQLKKDLLRTAHLTGFQDEVRRFEKMFDMTYAHDPSREQGDLVFFWQNGLGPVKAEQSILFTLVRGSGGAMHFENEEMGLSFPVPASEARESGGKLGDLRVVRVAFPKYVERPPVYAGARLGADGGAVDLHLAQDLNAVAFQALQDRMLREMGSALLRLAVRQAAEQRIRKEDENLGAIFGILGAVAEQADTRNWQTLPHSIFYTRKSLPAGEHRLSLELLLPNGNTAKTLHLDAQIREGRTTFMNFHTLDAKQRATRAGR